MKKDKKYDAVKEVRKVREKLSEKYWNKPDELKAVLEAAREKFAVSKKRPKA